MLGGRSQVTGAPSSSRTRSQSEREVPPGSHLRPSGAGQGAHRRRDEGLPSCAVPVGCDDGLPQGVQLIGARFREDLLLDAAQAVEDRAPVLTPIEPRVFVTA